MTEKTVGCHCGDVSLKTNFDPMLVAQCNCGRCRQLFGTVNVGMMYAEDQIEFSGSMSHYEFTGGSGMPVKTYFCANCGCRIYSRAESFPGMVGVVLGAFDDPHQFQPVAEIYANYKLDWLSHKGCIQESFEEAAVEERLMAILNRLEES